MKVRILGSAQDGGVPHLGCGCDTCSNARDGVHEQRSAASIKVSDEEKNVNYIFDVSPDIRHHLGDEFIDGVFLSHAHLGHVTGLLYLGKESFNADNVPVYCSDKVGNFLRENPPYRMLIDRENITLNEFDGPVSVMGLTVTPVPVENKGYLETDTNAFMVDDGDKKLFYITDVDRWTDETLEAVEEADVAIVDGCFWSAEELERYENVPHPPIQESLALFEDIGTEIIFTHINHTNPVLDPNSAERKQVEDAGFRIAEDGMEIAL